MRWSLKDLEEWLLIGSTLVEGSTLSEQEARDVLAGRTVSGHPAHEARELINYRSATAWLLEQVEQVREWLERFNAESTGDARFSAAESFIGARVLKEE